LLKPCKIIKTETDGLGEPVSKELSQRLLIAAVGIPLLIWVFYSGGIVLRLGLGLISVIGMWEYRKIIFKDKPLWVSVDIVFAICIYIFYGSLMKNLVPSCQLPAWICIAFFFVLRSLVWLAGKTGTRTFKNYILTVWGLFYLAVLPGLIYLIDASYHEKRLLLLLLILIWITDSTAYFIGIRFGKHRGIFPMSPNKSLEGFIAGLTAPFVFVILLYIFNRQWNITHLAVAALSAGVFGQLGDLLESKLKRIGGVKDSSNIIPGHGGILDRFDSLLVAGPVMYCLLTFIP
jgi:phosphatidate cytidylyltransferase